MRVNIYEFDTRIFGHSKSQSVNTAGYCQVWRRGDSRDHFKLKRQEGLAKVYDKRVYELVQAEPLMATVVNAK